MDPSATLIELMVNRKTSIRLYVPEPLWDHKDMINLDQPAGHYIKNVMRLSEGDSISIFNNTQGEWIASVTTIHKKSVAVTPLAQTRAPEAPSEVHLCFCPLKQTALSFLIEKATELGVTHLHPILSERTVVRTFNRLKNHRIAIEASEQCTRISIPEMTEMVSLTHFLQTLKPDGHQILYCDERRTGVFLNQLDPKGIPYFFIGPEGGFTDLEITALARMPQSSNVKLSQHILRAETAALSALSQWTLQAR